jgi:hypothetical protein
MKRYEVTLKGGRRFIVEGNVFLFNQDSDVVVSKNIDNYYNAREVLSVREVKEEGNGVLVRSE